MANRIKELRKNRDLSMEALAERMSTTAPTVSKLEKGQLQLTESWLRRLAQALQVPMASIFDEEIPAESLPVIGKVQAGAWSPAEEWDEAERYRAPARISPRYPVEAQFLVENRGPSMNKVFPDGALLHCVAFRALGRDPQHEEVVLVRRRNLAGDIEATVKRCRIDEDGKLWLWPESSDPRFQQPIAYGDDSEEVEVVARVLAFMVTYAEI